MTRDVALQHEPQSFSRPQGQTSRLHRSLEPPSKSWCPVPGQQTMPRFLTTPPAMLQYQFGDAGTPQRTSLQTSTRRGRLRRRASPGGEGVGCIGLRRSLLATAVGRGVLLGEEYPRGPEANQRARVAWTASRSRCAPSSRSWLQLLCRWRRAPDSQKLRRTVRLEDRPRILNRSDSHVRWRDASRRHQRSPRLALRR